jgi:hypothetical protein
MVAVAPPNVTGSHPIASSQRAATIGIRTADLVEGAVVQTHGPSQMRTPRSGWTIGSALLIVAALLPIGLVFWFVAFAFGLLLALIGFGRRAGGRGLFTEILVFQWVRVLFDRPEPTPVYHHVVRTADALVSVRQEGEFAGSRIILGHRVRLRGQRRGGTLVVRDGQDLTLDAELVRAPNVWRAVFVGLVVVVAAEYSLLFGMAGSLLAMAQ